MSPKILIADDTPANVALLSDTLEPHGYEILVAPNGEVALKVAARALPDLILMDVIMPGRDGFSICAELKQMEATRDIPVIFITGMNETSQVTRGFEVGGVDYILKPFQAEEVISRVSTHLKISSLTKALREKNRELEVEVEQRRVAEEAKQRADERLSALSDREAEHWGVAGFVGKSRTVAKILSEVQRLHHFANTGVLITGESGTGKELIARAIHFGSPRAKAPFIAVNCIAVPGELAESMLFGHIRGAFTGATTDRKGCFEMANGGTLFLDEIGDMPTALQGKLLRVLEDGCITPVGGTHSRKVDVRVIAATNAHLQDSITGGTFRQDLYFRLARYTVHTPRLEERKEDVPLLAEHFLRVFATEMGMRTPVLTHDALSALSAYSFPGNVRELKNIIERALIESGGNSIRPVHLNFQTKPNRYPQADDAENLPVMQQHASSHEASSAAAEVRTPKVSVDEMPLNLKQAEDILIQRALSESGGNIAKAARLLGVHRTRIYRRFEANFPEVDP
jgi:DNA-binding NtrC family response regulator